MAVREEPQGEQLQLQGSTDNLHSQGEGNTRNIKWKFYFIDPKILRHHPVGWTKAYKYAKDMEGGDKFPPVKVSRLDTGQLLVQDGAHRTMAAKLTGKELFIRTKLDLKNARKYNE